MMGASVRLTVTLMLVLVLSQSVWSMGWWSSIPLVGHAEGVAHYVMGNNDAGDECMRGASRTTALIGGGIVGGPAGAMAAGVAYDAIEYGINHAVNGDEAKLGGTLGAIQKTADEGGSTSSIVGLVTNVAMDGVSGVGGGCSSAVTKTVSNAVSTSIKQGASKAVVRETTKTVTKIVAKSAAANSGSAVASVCIRKTVETTVAVSTDPGTSTSTSTSTDARVPEREVAETVTEEEEAEEERERGHINVFRTNYTLVYRRLPNDHADLIIWQLRASVRRMVTLRQYFRLPDRTDPSISPDPPGGPPRPFTEPLEQVEAKCTILSVSGETSVLVSVGTGVGRTAFSPSVYCTMVSASGWMSEGVSVHARERIRTIHRGNENGPLWIGTEGEFDSIVANRLVEHQSNVPQVRPEVRQTSCAEHHAWYNLRTVSQEAPISTMSFRMDSAGRVFVAPRCPNCVGYVLGCSLTDHLPPNMWLNAPSLLNVYV